MIGEDILLMLCWIKTHTASRNTSYPSTTPAPSTASSLILTTTQEEPEIIDVDQDIDMIEGSRSHPIHKPSHKPVKWACEGIHVEFPEGKNAHMSYPFGLHSKHAVPWNY